MLISGNALALYQDFVTTSPGHGMTNPTEPTLRIRPLCSPTRLPQSPIGRQSTDVEPVAVYMNPSRAPQEDSEVGPRTLSLTVLVQAAL